MSIYSDKQILEKVSYLSRDEMYGLFCRFLEKSRSKLARDELADLVMNPKREVAGKVVINHTRPVSVSRVKKLLTSPVINGIPEIVKAALYPGGPYTARDILLFANNWNKGALLPEKKITHNELTYTGYILSMAGFERVSVYNKGRSPLKCWRTTEHYKNEPPEWRVQMVEFAINDVAEVIKPKPITSLEDLI